MEFWRGKKNNKELRKKRNERKGDIWKRIWKLRNEEYRKIRWSGEKIDGEKWI